MQQWSAFMFVCLFFHFTALIRLPFVSIHWVEMSFMNIKSFLQSLWLSLPPSCWSCRRESSHDSTMQHWCNVTCSWRSYSYTAKDWSSAGRTMISQFHYFCIWQSHSAKHLCNNSSINNSSSTSHTGLVY